MKDFWISILVGLVTYAGLAWGRVPRLRIDRAGIALIGATAMILAGTLPFDEAMRAIDHETIALLFGMMVVVGALRLAGFFERLGEAALGRLTSPVSLLAVTVFLSGILSAFFVNDVICIAMTPVVLALTAKMGLSPVPYLIALATAANIGSAGTIIGNPQNMIIGTASGIGFGRFAFRAMPVALLGLALNFFWLAFLYRGKLRAAAPPLDLLAAGRRTRLRPTHRRLLRAALLVAGCAVVLFFSGMKVALVALLAASTLVLLLGRMRPERIYRDLDWSLLLMFAGLFIVVRGVELHLLARWNPAEWPILTADPLAAFAAGSAVLSNLVSNVPAVLLFKPLLPAVAEAQREDVWIVLALASTFAGNLTILGSVANLIVVEIARRKGVMVSFLEYLWAGLPITLLTVFLGYSWIRFVVY